MYSLISLCILFCVAPTLAQEKLELDGAIVLSDSEALQPQAGTIRWTGNDFEGWNGLFWVSLTSKTLGSISDADGNTYRTLVIGGKEWMIENLRTTVYNDTTPIVEVTDSAAWGIVSSGAYCWYNNDRSTHEITYGALFNWFAVESGNVCPEGWHVPDDLLGNLDFSDMLSMYGGLFTGGVATKSTGNQADGTGLWPFPNSATNESGFTGHPGGLRKDDGAFSGLGTIGTFWTSEEDPPDHGWRRLLRSTDQTVLRSNSDKNFGVSIRCVKN